MVINFKTKDYTNDEFQWVMTLINLSKIIFLKVSINQKETWNLPRLKKQWKCFHKFYYNTLFMFIGNTYKEAKNSQLQNDYIPGISCPHVSCLTQKQSPGGVL